MGLLQEWNADRSQHLAIYAAFSQYANSNGFCWACGRSSQFRDKPKDFCTPWIIHRAHIVSKPRLQDRRVVNLLCPVCHAIADDGGDDRISLAHMIFLKQLFDPNFFDITLLQRCSIRRLPAACDLDPVLLVEFQSRRGLTRRQIDT